MISGLYQRQTTDEEKAKEQQAQAFIQQIGLLKRRSIVIEVAKNGYLIREGAGLGDYHSPDISVYKTFDELVEAIKGLIV